MEELDNHLQENSENNLHESRQEIFSETVRAGKRTYFFDVKSTRGGEYYLTITESKRRFNNDSGKFFYEKHKLFLYKEDFEKFANGLKSTIDFIQSGKSPEPVKSEPKEKNNPHVDVEFEDLGTETAEISATNDSEEKKAE
jgi:hypothetical protein